MQTTALPLASCIGFSGSVENGLQLHPDGQTLVYPLGSTIVVRDLKGLKQQDFLQGHTDKVGVPGTLRHVRPEKEAMQPQLLSATRRCHAWPSASQGATWPQVRCGVVHAMPLTSTPASRSMPSLTCRAADIHGSEGRHHPVGPGGTQAAAQDEPAQREPPAAMLSPMLRAARPVTPAGLDS